MLARSSWMATLFAACVAGAMCTGANAAAPAPSTSASAAAKAPPQADPTGRAGDAALARIPVLSPRLLGTVRFGEPPPDGNSRLLHSLHQYNSFAIDDRGRFGKTDSMLFVLLDADGKPLRSIALPELKGGASIHSTWLTGNRWVVFMSTDHRTRAYWIDVGNTTLAPIPGFDTPRVEMATRTADGGFVLLAVDDVRQDKPESLWAFDRQGRKRWNFTGFHLGELPAPKSLAVVHDRIVLAADTPRRTTRLLEYGMDGKAAGVVDVALPPGSLGIHESLVAGSGGQLVLGSDSLIATLAPDGRVLARIRPSYDGHHAIETVAGVQADTQGRLWVEDGRAFLRLDDKGIPDRTAGERFDAERVTQSAGVGVDARGRIYQLDGRSGNIHVYDADGHGLRVLHPEPEDCATSQPALTVAPEGDVYLSSNRQGRIGHTHFAPDGRRVGIESLALGSDMQQWMFQPTSGKRWIIVGTGKIDLVGGNGKVEATIAGNRGTILRASEAAVAPDGSLAIVVSEAAPTGLPDRSDDSDEPPEVQSVRIYAPDGKAVANWRIPFVPYVDGIAFDGRRVVVPAITRAVRGTGASDRPHPETQYLVMDLRGRPLFRFKEETAGASYFVQGKDGSELWLRSDRDAFGRYALP